MPKTVVFRGVALGKFVVDRWTVHEWHDEPNMMSGSTHLELAWDFQATFDDMFLDEWQAMISALVGHHVLVTTIERPFSGNGPLRLRLAGAVYPNDLKKATPRRRVRKPRAPVIVVPLKSRAME